MSGLVHNKAIFEFSEQFPSDGMYSPGWTNLEIKRALERIGLGLAVSNSEYVLAMQAFEGRSAAARS